MLYFLPERVKGLLAILLYTLNTIVLSIPLILLSFLKFILPFKGFIVSLNKVLMGIAQLWIRINTLNSKLFCRIHWDIRGLENLKKKEWYLVISNHQSWVDILVLQTILNNKIPLLKFFLKKELIWVPFLGLAWWALDFPFMKRYSKKQLAANPELKGQDLKRTQAACKKFKNSPVSIMNFVEGTRFTPQKKQRQESPYIHLLKPKAGGIAFVMSAMGEYLHKIIDITIIYPQGIPSFWAFISGRVKSIIVDFDVLDIPDDLRGDFFENPDLKKRFFDWLNSLWQKKDKKIHLNSEY